jgi:hypothetical protein
MRSILLTQSGLPQLFESSYRPGDYWIDTNELRRQLVALNKLQSVASASKTGLLAHQKEFASYPL